MEVVACLRWSHPSLFHLRSKTVGSPSSHPTPSIGPLCSRRRSFHFPSSLRNHPEEEFPRSFQEKAENRIAFKRTQDLKQKLPTHLVSPQSRRRGFRGWSTAIVLGLAIVLQPGPHSALAFGWFGGAPAIEKDPVEPFTLYGSVFKKYYIEKIVDGKVVSLKRGFTSTACVNALDANKETPELQGVPAGLKVVIIGEPLCTKSEGQTREESCTPSCKRACTAAISRHLAEVKEETGYVLDLKDREKVTESCSNQCSNECLKPGKTTSFIHPFRPSR